MLTSFVEHTCQMALYPLGIVLNKALKKAYDQSQLMEKQSKMVAAVADKSGREAAFSVQVNQEQEQDFLAFRSETYVKPMTQGVAKELAALLLRANAPKAADLEVLKKMFFASAGALITSWNEAEQCFVSDFSALRPSFFEGYYKEIAFFKANPDRNFYQIIDHAGRIYAPGDELWETAVHHLVALYTIAIPMGSHNWVHFCYPEVMGEAVFQKLNRNSILYRMLAPHVRFTNRINYQAVWVQKSTNNTPRLADKMVPWKCFPLYGEDFRDGVIGNTHLHYAELEAHFEYPQTMDQRLPYFRYLKGYYDIIEEFCRNMWPHIEAAEWENLVAAIEEHLPGFGKIDPVKALAVLIWQVSILHGVEHHSYFDLAERYGFTEVKKPIHERFTLKDVSLYNRYRLRCFLNVFVIFNPNEKLDQKLTAIDAYGFAKHTLLERIAQKFARDLRAHDYALQQKGEAIVKLDKIVQSVCY